MNTTERKRLAVAVGALAEAYRQTITAATIAAYELALDDMPIAAIEGAVRRGLRESRFMPTAHELRELAGESSPADRAVVAWQAVVNANYKHGYTVTVSFDDPAINATIRTLGGWESFTERMEQEPVWAQKDFERVYQTFCRRGVMPREAAPLGGFHSRSNHGRFPSHVPQPVLIHTTLPPTPLLRNDIQANRPALPSPMSYAEGIGLMLKEAV